MEIFARLSQLTATGAHAAVVTVVETHGSTPRKSGARMIVFADGATEGTIGGGRVEHAVTSDAQRVVRTEVPEVVEYKLSADLAMCCGGRMKFFVEPLVTEPPLLVFGCGHVGAAIIAAAAPLRFDITAIDDASENTTPERLPQAARVHNSYEADIFDTLPFGPRTHVLICTREHALDQRLLEHCLRHETAYVGVIGSQRKAHSQRQRLLAKSFTEQDIARVSCPVGIDIGAQTPEEIAISICAELIQSRRALPDPT